MAKPRRSRRTLSILVVLILVSVTIITLDETDRLHVLTTGTKRVASDVFSPVRRGVDSVIDPIGRFFAGAVHYGSLEKENQDLRLEIGQLEQMKDESAFDSRQYHQLNQLLALERLPSLSSLPMVLAATTSQSVSDFDDTITIDKGSDDGVSDGDPVVGAGGLIGEVTFVYPGSATVQLVTDHASSVGVVYGTDEYATLDGQGQGKPLSASFVASSTAVTVGETMATDGLAGAAFPAGIPVAKVASVRDDPGASDKQVTATPVADLSHLTYVAVVQWGPGA